MYSSYRFAAGALLTFVAGLALVHHFAANVSAQTPAAPADKPYVVEYYYKAKWGFADEFLTLYKKNHLPVMRKEMEMGRILQLSMVRPRYHATEDGRWDFRMTITWKSVGVATDGFDESTITKPLYPDQATFKQEEQRRFEILLAHWDLPLVDVDIAK